MKIKKQKINNKEEYKNKYIVTQYYEYRYDSWENDTDFDYEILVLNNNKSVIILDIILNNVYIEIFEELIRNIFRLYDKMYHVNRLDSYEIKYYNNTDKKYKIDINYGIAEKQIILEALKKYINNIHNIMKDNNLYYNEELLVYLANLIEKEGISIL